MKNVFACLKRSERVFMLPPFTIFLQSMRFLNFAGIEVQNRTPLRLHSPLRETNNLNLGACGCVPAQHIIFNFILFYLNFFFFFFFGFFFPLHS